MSTRMNFQLKINSEDPDLEGLCEFLEEVINKEVKDWLKECLHKDQKFELQSSISHEEQEDNHGSR